MGIETYSPTLLPSACVSRGWFFDERVCLETQNTQAVGTSTCYRQRFPLLACIMFVSTIARRTALCDTRPWFDFGRSGFDAPVLYHSVLIPRWWAHAASMVIALS